MLRRRLSTLNGQASNNKSEVARYVVMFLRAFAALKFEVKTRNFSARASMQPGKRDPATRDPRSDVSYSSASNDRSSV